MSQKIFDNALLLRRVAYGDADWVSTWLLQTHGKATLFARNARKSKKRFAGGVEPFCLYSTALRLPRGDSMGAIYEAHTEERWEEIPLDLHRLAAASHLLTTTATILNDSQGAGAFFAFITNVLRWLNTTEQPPHRIETGFQRAQLRMIAAFGILPSLTHTSDTDEPIATLEHAWLLPEEGLCAQRQGGEVLATPLTEDDLEYLILVLGGKFPPNDRPRARHTLRQAINNVIRYQFDKELKTWDFYSETFSS